MPGHLPAAEHSDQEGQGAARAQARHHQADGGAHCLDACLNNSALLGVGHAELLLYCSTLQAAACLLQRMQLCGMQVRVCLSLAR